MELCGIRDDRSYKIPYSVNSIRATNFVNFKDDSSAGSPNSGYDELTIRVRGSKYLIKIIYGENALCVLFLPVSSSLIKNHSLSLLKLDAMRGIRISRGNE